MQIPNHILGKWSDKWWSLPVAFLLLIFCSAITLLIFIWFVDQNFELAFYDEASVEFWTFALASVAIFHIPLSVTFILVYRRNYFNIINPLKLPIQKDIQYALIFSLFSIVSSLVIFYPISLEGEGISYIWQPKLWIIWVVPFFILVFLQISAEEFLLRGWFQPYLRALTSKKIIYLLLPALIFTALHYWNFEDSWEKWSALISIFTVAIIWGDWADQTSNLWGPVLMHFINNFILFVVIGSNLEPSELSIWQYNINLENGQNLAIAMIIHSLINGAFYYFYIRNRLPNQTHS